MICKHCHAENKENTTYCSNCGKPLVEELEHPRQSQGGQKLYIAISIALMVILAGGLVFGFLYFSSKVQKANEERNTIASESDVAAAYFKNQLSVQDNTIAELKGEIASLTDAVQGYQEEVQGYKEQIADLKANNIAMEGLASFTDAQSGQGYEDMFVSDTVLHLSAEAEEGTVVRVCIENDMEIKVISSNPEVATCEWDSVPVGPTVARLRINPGETGVSMITLTNNYNEEEINIYIYVD